MKIEDYIQGQVLDTTYIFSDAALQGALLPKKYAGINGTIVVKNGIEMGRDVMTISNQMEIDLALAELWKVAAGLADGGGSSKTMGNRSVKDRSMSSSDADKNFRIGMAKEIWTKYGVLDGTPYVGQTTVTNKTPFWQ